MRLKQFADEFKGVKLQNLWEDIPPIGAHAAERLGYPTQKPEALLERIISASSDEGDTVLDPFCGCGTTVAAAQKLNRRWVGIDITHLAITLIKERLKGAFGKGIKETYQTIGEPEDLAVRSSLPPMIRISSSGGQLVGRREARRTEKGRGQGHRRSGSISTMKGTSPKRKQVIFGQRLEKPVPIMFATCAVRRG